MNTFKRPDGELAFWASEAGQGEAVVLVHGFPMTHAIWRPLLSRMSPHRRYILPDLRGFGESTAPLTGNNTLGRLADDNVELLDHLQIERAHLVGASMGGMIATKLAYRQPHRVASLTVFNTVAQAETDAGKERRIRQLATLRDQGVEQFTSGFAAGLFPEGTPAAAVDFLARNMAKAKLESVIAGLELLSNREDQTKHLSNVRAPALMIAGEHDGGSSPEMMGEMARLCPQGELKIIEGSGHMPTIQLPDLAACILEDWLTKQETGSAA